jgi:hypothetical protein
MVAKCLRSIRVHKSFESFNAPGETPGDHWVGSLATWHLMLAWRARKMLSAIVWHPV